MHEVQRGASAVGVEEKPAQKFESLQIESCLHCIMRLFIVGVHEVDVWKKRGHQSLYALCMTRTRSLSDGFFSEKLCTSHKIKLMSKSSNYDRLLDVIRWWEFASGYIRKKVTRRTMKSIWNIVGKSRKWFPGESSNIVRRENHFKVQNLPRNQDILTCITLCNLHWLVIQF